MKVTFLGTGTSQGVPIIGCKCAVCTSKQQHDKRLRSSVWVQHKGKSFVIDTGPDFRQQMLQNNVPSIDFVLLTHAHKDHIAGLDDIRAYNHLQQSPIDIYADKRTLQSVQREFAYAFDPSPYPGVPDLRLHEVNEEPFTAHEINVLPIKVLHMNLPILGFRIDDFAYITDESFIAKSEIEKLRGLNLLILDALRIEKHYSHFNLQEALDLVQLVKPKTTFFTHISHYMGLHDEVNSRLPENCRLGYDGLEIEI